MKQRALIQNGSPTPTPVGVAKFIKSVDIPFQSYEGSAVVYNDKIHLLGGFGNGGINHYTWDGKNWTQLSNIPYSLVSGNAVVYNNKIHILGSTYSDDNKKHYSWDGTNWTEESTLPYNFIAGEAVVYNNKIHILGGQDQNASALGFNYHYSWDGSNWIEESTLPYGFYYGTAIVYNDKIHILSGEDNYINGEYIYNKTKHYSWNNGTWIEEPSLLSYADRGWGTVYNNKIHILGGPERRHQVFDGNSWKYEIIIPEGNYYGGWAVVYKDNLETSSGNTYFHYVFVYTLNSSGNNSQQKTATPYTTSQSVTPDTGYDYLSQVDVESIYYNESANGEGILATLGKVAPGNGGN